MKNLSSRLKSFKFNKDGATAIEYGLIAALISVVIILSVTTLGRQMNKTFSTVGSSIGSANTL